jgi:ParB-like chromosome segregation protein Spo0J
MVGNALVAPSSLLANPKNWRVHTDAQRTALSALLDKVGWVQDVIVNQRTGHLLDGHLRLALAESRGEPEIPVKYVDLSEAEEDMVLATIDPLSAMAGRDDTMLVDLLAGVEVDGELASFLEGLTGVAASWVTEAEFSTVVQPTQEQIDRRSAQMENRFSQASTDFQEGLIELECPDCGGHFSIKEDDLDKPGR